MEVRWIPSLLPRVLPIPTYEPLEIEPTKIVKDLYVCTYIQTVAILANDYLANERYGDAGRLVVGDDSVRL